MKKFNELATTTLANLSSITGRRVANLHADLQNRAL